MLLVILFINLRMWVIRCREFFREVCMRLKIRFRKGRVILKIRWIRLRIRFGWLSMM